VARITIDPVFDISTGKLLSHSGQYEIPENEIVLRFDRGATSQAKTQGKQATGEAGASQGRATSEYGTLEPILQREATSPYGMTPLEKSSAITSSGEALGGVNAGLGGEARLNSMRTRNASGFAPALAEAGREKGREQASNQLRINMADAEIARQRQQQALAQLQGLYGTDTSNMLRSMGIANQDLETQLAAGRQGWLQNTEGVINTLSGAAKAAADIQAGRG
jgi:hypothetical protein